jgi:hypothetical protein
MTIKGKISDLIHPKKEFKQLLRASELARVRKKDKFFASHIGHLLAVMCYDENDNHLETLFVDHIDVRGSHTVIVFDKDYFEYLPFSVGWLEVAENRLKIGYKNKTSIEVIRIS